MMSNEKVMNTKVSYLIKINNFDIGHFLIRQSYDNSVHKFLLSCETYQCNYVEKISCTSLFEQSNF
jgi:hypothetical protein